PVEAAFAQRIPAVQWIAPALAGGGEVVRRHARDADQLPLFIQLEEIRVGPDVRAVVVDEYGNVAEDADVARVRVFAQRGPLLADQVLNRLFDREVAAGLIHRL